MHTDLLNSIIDDTPTIAPKRLRIAAALIDLVIFWAAGFILGIFFGTSFTEDEGSFGYKLDGYPALVLALIWLILMPINEGIIGQTIGKRVLKIKVVKVNYASTTLLSSLVRHALDIIDIILFIGLLVAALNKKKQRIGDLVAGTIVVLNNQSYAKS